MTCTYCYGYDHDLGACEILKTHQRNLQHKKAKQEAEQQPNRKQEGEAQTKARVNPKTYERRQQYMHEIMKESLKGVSKVTQNGSTAHRTEERTGPQVRFRRFRMTSPTPRVRFQRFQAMSPAQQASRIARRSRLHGWSENDTNWRVKKADRSDWRRGLEHTKGLRQTSHRGQCSNRLRTWDQDPSWDMTSQSLTAPIACQKVRGPRQDWL